MGKFKIGLQLDVKFLEELSKEKTSGVTIQRSKHHVVMHPIHLKNFSGSIKDLLNVGVGKFDKKLGGILLGYRNIKLINEKGIIHNDSSGIHVDLEGDFFVFKPGIGREMHGVVNQMAKDFVGVLVYKTFNISIPKPQNEDKWLGHDVQVGYEVLFQIQHVDMSLHLPYIRGELLSIISKPDVDKNPAKNKGKPKKTVFEDTETPSQHQDEPLANEESVEGTDEVKIKKKKDKIKKRKSAENNENEHVILEGVSKKSGKRKATESTTEDGKKLFLSNLPHKKSKKLKYSEIPT